MENASSSRLPNASAGWELEDGKLLAGLLHSQDAASRVKKELAHRAVVARAEQKLKSSLSASRCYSSSHSSGRCMKCDSSEATEGEDAVRQAAVDFELASILKRAFESAQKGKRIVHFLESIYQNPPTSNSGADIMMPMQQQSELFTMRRMIDMFESMGDGELLIAFYAELTDHFMKQEPLSLSSKWHRMGLDFVSQNSCRVDIPGRDSPQAQPLMEIPELEYLKAPQDDQEEEGTSCGENLYVSREHDPLGLVQRLFDSAANIIDSSPDPLSRTTAISLCIVLAVKSARISLLIRVLQFLVLEENKNNKIILHTQWLGEIMHYIALNKQAIESKKSSNENALDAFVPQLSKDPAERPRAAPGKPPEGGILLSFGKAEHGRLGHGDTQINRLIPTVIERLKDIKIQKAVSMSSFSIAIDTKGVAYIWGTGGTTASVSYGSRVDTLPTVMESLRVSVPVVDLSCGLGHALFLVEGHKVYCWGNGGNGRLGLGNTQDRFEACPVLELEGVNIASICCGASHSMAVSDTGKLYCWGKNSAGQCSKAGGDDVLTPLLVTQLKDEFIKTIAAGWDHSLALTESGRVYAWGGGYKDSRRGGVPPVLGLGHTEARSSPERIPAFNNVKIADITSGWDHCMARDTNGALYTWGSGQNGKLGHGNESNQSVPTLVKHLEGVTITHMSAGCEHSAAIDSSGRLFTWGHGEGGRLGRGDNHSDSTPKEVAVLPHLGLRAHYVLCGDKYTLLIGTPIVESKKPSNDPAKQLSDYASSVHQLVSIVAQNAYTLSSEEIFPQIEVTCLQLSRMLGLALFDSLSYISGISMKESMTEKPFFLDRHDEDTDDIVFGVEVDRMTFRSFSGLLSIMVSSDQYLGHNLASDSELNGLKEELLDDFFMTSCLQLLKQNLERFQRKMRQIDFMNNSSYSENMNVDIDLISPPSQSLKISNIIAISSSRGVDLSSEESGDAADYVDLRHYGEEKESDSDSEEGLEQSPDPLLNTAASDKTASSASSQPLSPHQRRSYNNNNVLGSPMDRNSLAKDAKEDFSSVLDQLIVATASNLIENENIVLPTSDETDVDDSTHRPSFFRGGGAIEEDRGLALMYRSELDLVDHTTITSRIELEAAEARVPPSNNRARVNSGIEVEGRDPIILARLNSARRNSSHPTGVLDETELQTTSGAEVSEKRHSFEDDTMGSRRETETFRRSNSPAMSRESWENRNSDAFNTPTAQYLRSPDPEGDDAKYSDPTYDSAADGLPEKVLSEDIDDSYAMQKALLLSLDQIDKDNEVKGEPIIRSGFVRNMKTIRVTLHALALTSYRAMALKRNTLISDTSDRNFVLWMSVQESLSAGLSTLYTYQDITSVVYGIMKDPQAWFHILPGAICGLRVSGLFAAVSKRILSDIIRDLTNKHVKSYSPNKKSTSKFRSLTSSPEKSSASSSPFQLRMTDLKRALHFGLDRFIRQCDTFWEVCDIGKKYDPEIHVARSYFVLLEMSVSYIIERSTSKMTKEPIEGLVVDQNFLWEGKIVFEVMSLIVTIICEELSKLMSLVPDIRCKSVYVTSFDWCFTTQVISKFSSFFLQADDYDVCLVWFPHAVTIIKALVRHIAVLDVAPAERGTYKSVLRKWMIQQNRWILLYFAMMSTGTEKCKPVKPMMPLRPLYTHAASLISLDAIMSTSSQWMVNMDKIESRKFVLLFCQLPQLFVENDIIHDTSFQQAPSTTDPQTSKDLINFLYSGAFSAPRKQTIVSGSWVETLVSHLLQASREFNILSSALSIDMGIVDALHQHLTDALQSRLHHVKDIILKTDSPSFGSLFSQQCFVEFLGISGKFAIPQWISSDSLKLPRIMMFAIAYQCTSRLEDASDDALSLEDFFTKEHSKAVFDAWTISYFVTNILFLRMMQDQRLSLSNAVPIFVHKCRALLKYIDCLQKMPHLVHFECFAAPDVTFEKISNELEIVQLGMSILSRHLGLVGQGGSKLWEELSIESYLAARNCRVVGETPKCFFDCNLVAISGAIVGHISLDEIVESMAWSSASSAAFHLSSCLLAWITRMVRTVPEMQRYYMDALLIFHRHLMAEPGQETVESLLCSMMNNNDEYDFDLSKYQFELSSENDAIERLDTEVTGQLRAIGGIFQQEAAAYKSMPREQAKRNFEECLKSTISDLVKHIQFLRFTLLQAKGRVICSSISIELPAIEYKPDSLKGASKTIPALLEQLGNMIEAVDQFALIFPEEDWSVDENLFEIVWEGVTSIINSIAEFDMESFNDESNGDQIKLQVMHLSLRLSSWGSSQSAKLYKYFRSNCFLEQNYENDHVVLNNFIKSLTRSNISIYNGLQSPDGAFSIRVWLFISSQFIKAQLQTTTACFFEENTDSDRIPDSSEFCHFVHVFSRVPESYDVNEVALLKRINSKDLKSLPSLYVGLMANGTAHLVLSASALLPEMAELGTKTQYQSSSQASSEAAKRRVELVSHRLAMDQWIQVDVSLAHSGREDMASRDLYDLSLLLNRNVDVHTSVVFRGQSLHHNIIYGSVPSASSIISFDISDISSHIAATDLRWIPYAYRAMPLRPADEANGFLKIPRWYLHRKMSKLSEFIVGSTSLLSKVCRVVSQSQKSHMIVLEDVPTYAEKLSSICYVLKALHYVLVIGNTSAQEYAFDSILQMFAILSRSLSTDEESVHEIKAAAFVSCEMLTSIVGMIVGLWKPILIDDESTLLEEVENETEHVDKYRMPPRLKKLWLLRIQNRMRSRGTGKQHNMSDSEEFIDGNSFIWKACRIISFAINHSLISVQRFLHLPETDPEFPQNLIRFIMLLSCGGWINSVGFHSTVDLFTRTLFFKSDLMSVDHVAFTSSALAEHANGNHGTWLKDCTGSVCKKAVTHPLSTKNPNHLGPSIFPAPSNTRLPGSEFVTLRDVFYPVDITVFPPALKSILQFTRNDLCGILKRSIDGVHCSRDDPLYSSASSAVFDLTLAVCEIRSVMLQLVRIEGHQLREADSSAPSVISAVCKLLPNLVEIADINYASVISSLMNNMKLKPPQLELLKNLLKEGDIHMFEKIAVRLWPLARDSTNPPARATSNEGSSSEKRGPVAISGELQINDCKIRAVNHFPSVKILDVQLKRMTGRWFYECILMTDGLMQIGWADKSFRCDPSCGHGVGDHPHSWAFDGCRMKKWNVSCENYGQRWKVGDVVGVLVDMDLLEMNFFLNGKNLGTAFSGFPGDSLYPALSINVRQCLRVNYGQYRFVYPPDAIDFFEYRPVIQGLTLLVPSPALKKGEANNVSIKPDENEVGATGGSTRNNNTVDDVLRTGSGGPAPTSLLSLLENVAASIPAGTTQRDMNTNSAIGIRNSTDSDSGLTHVSNQLIRALDVSISNSINFDRNSADHLAQIEDVRRNQEHQVNISNSTEDSESSESSDEDASSGEDEEEDEVQRFRQSMERDNTLGRGDRDNEDVVNQELEFRRQALIENLIAMGFPVDWALRAAEHCESSVSESAAITWIIERMELEQTKLDEFDSSDSRMGTEMDGLADEGSSGFDQQRSSLGAANRVDISPNRGGSQATQSMISDLHNMVLNNGNDARTVDSNYLTHEHGSNLAFGDGVESGQNGSHNLSSYLHTGGDCGDFVAYLPIDDKMGKGYCAWNSDRLYSTVMPGRDANKFKTNIDKQEILLQLSSLEPEELYSIVIASEFALSILYARSTVGRFLSIVNACAAQTFHNAGGKKLCVDIFTLLSGILNSNQTYLMSSIKMMFKGALTPFNQPDKLFPIIFCQTPSLPLLDIFIEYENSIFIGHLNKLEYEVLCTHAAAGHNKDGINASLIAQSRLNAIAVDSSTLDAVATVKNFIFNATNCSISGKSDCAGAACEFVLKLIDDSLSQIDGMLHCRDDYCDWISGERTRVVPVPVPAGASVEGARRLEMRKVFGLWAIFVLKTILDTVTASPFPIAQCSKLSVLWSNFTLIRILKCSASSNVSVRHLCNLISKSIISYRMIIIHSQLENSSMNVSESTELNNNFLHRIIVEFISDSRDHLLFASRLKVELLSNRVYSKYSLSALTSLAAYRGFLKFNKRVQSRSSKLKLNSNQVVKVLGCSRLTNKEVVNGMNNCIFKWEEIIDSCSGALLNSSRNGSGDTDTFANRWANRPQFYISGIGSTHVIVSWNVSEELQRVRMTLQSKISIPGKFHDIKLALVICIGNANDVMNGGEGHVKWMHQTSDCIGAYRIEGIEPDQRYIVSLTLRWNSFVISTTDEKAASVSGNQNSVGLSSFQLPLQLPGSLASRIMRSVGGASGSNKVTATSSPVDGSTKTDFSDDGSLGPDGKDASRNDTKLTNLFPSSFADDVMVAEHEVPIDDSCFEYPMSYSLSFSTESETQFLLDHYNMAAPLILGANSLSVKNKVNKKWSTIRATVRLSSGVHRWGVHIDRCVSKNIFIGVVAEEARCDNYVGCDRFGWAFLANRAIWHNKSKTKSYGELFATGDMIVVTLNLTKGTLSFSLNGKDLGVAADGLVGPLYPAFSLYNEDDQISIIPMKSVSSVPRLRSPLDDLAIKGNENMLPLTASDPDEFSGSFSSCIDSFIERIELCRSLLTYLVFCNRLDGQEFDYKRAFMEVPRYSDAERNLCNRWARWAANGWTRSICSSMGAHAEVAICSGVPCLQASNGGSDLVLMSGDVVKTQNGLEAVIGVGDHRVWFQLIDSGGIYSAARDDIISAFAKGLLTLHERSKLMNSGPGSAHITMLGRSEFIRLLRCDIFQFPPHLDAHLVEWLELLARWNDCHPCNLRMCDVISPQHHIEEVELLLKNDKGCKYSHAQYLHKFRPLRQVGVDLLRIRALAIIAANDVVLSSVVMLGRPQNLKNIPDSRPPLSWDMEALLFRSKSIIFRQVKFDIAARIGGDFYSHAFATSPASDPERNIANSRGALDLPVTHDCSPIPFIFKNGAYFAAETTDSSARKVGCSEDKNFTKSHASRRQSKLWLNPIFELEQKSILARELLEKCLSQGVQRQLLCDIRWRMLSGYQTSLLGQLFRRFEFIADGNHNGFDSMFDRVSVPPKSSDTTNDPNTAGLGLSEASVRTNFTWEVSMRKHMRPGVQWEDWIPPSGRRCPLLIRASARPLLAAIDEHHEIRNRPMFQISMWDPEYFYWILESLRPSSSACNQRLPNSSSATQDPPVPECSDGAALTNQGITPCAISDFNLFEYYLRAAIAEMEGLLQPDIIDAIYEGNCPGEIGILMHMMHAIGVVLGLALRLGVQIQTRTIPDLYWAACAGETSRNAFAASSPHGLSVLHDAVASAMRHGLTSIYPETALSYWTSNELRDILSCQSDVSNVCILRESSELARDDLVVAIMEECNFSCTFAPFPNDKIYIEYFWLALAELARRDRIKLLRALSSEGPFRKHDHIYFLSFSAPQWVSSEIGIEEQREICKTSLNRDCKETLGAADGAGGCGSSCSRGLHVALTILPPAVRSTAPLPSVSASSDDDLPITLFPSRSALSIPRYSGVAPALHQLTLLVATL